MQALRLVLLGILTSKALVHLLKYSSQRPGNGLCHALDLYISGTIPLRIPPVKLFCPALNFAFPGKNFATAHGSIEPPDLDLASVFHAVSLKSPRPLPES